MQFNIEIIDSRHFVSSEFRGKPPRNSEFFMTVCKMSVEEKLRKLRGKRKLEILINSQRGKFSVEFYGKWGIRVECTVLMKGFNKTEAAVFSCRLCFLRAFVFISLNYTLLYSGLCNCTGLNADTTRSLRNR